MTIMMFAEETCSKNWVKLVALVLFLFTGITSRNMGDPKATVWLKTPP